MPQGFAELAAHGDVVAWIGVAAVVARASAPVLRTFIKEVFRTLRWNAALRRCLPEDLPKLVGELKDDTHDERRES